MVEGGLCDDEDDDEDDEDGFLLTRGVQTPVFRLRLLYSTSIRLRFRLGWLTTGEKIQPDIIRSTWLPGFSPGESRKTVKRQKQTQCDN